MEQTKRAPEKRRVYGLPLGTDFGLEEMERALTLGGRMPGNFEWEEDLNAYMASEKGTLDMFKTPKTAPAVRATENGRELAKRLYDGCIIPLKKLIVSTLWSEGLRLGAIYDALCTTDEIREENESDRDNRSIAEDLFARIQYSRTDEEFEKAAQKYFRHKIIGNP